MGLAGVLAALLAPFHFYFFPATYLLVGLYAVARRAWRRGGWLRDAALFLAPIVLAFPFVVGPALLQRDRGAIQLVVGWAEAPFEEGLGAVLFFYVTNLGLPLLLGLLALVASRPPARAFLAAWAVAFFLVPNVVVAGAVEFDMNKYFQVMWVALAILGGWLLRRRHDLRRRARPGGRRCLAGPRRHLARGLAAGRAEPRPGAGGALDRRQHAAAIGLPDRRLHQQPDRLRRTTADHDVRSIRREPRLRPGAARGRRQDRLLRWPGGGRRGDGALRRDLRAVSGGLPDCADGEPTDFSSSALFETVYDVDGVQVWRLRG